MCCSSTRIVKRVSFVLTRIQLCLWHFTSDDTDQRHNGSSDLLTPYREQPRSTRIVVTYPSQRSQQRSGQKITLQSVLINKPKFPKATSYKNKEKWNIEVHGGRGLELVKPARKLASSRPKPCASLKNAPKILPVGRSLLAIVGRKQTVVRETSFFFPSETFRFAPLILVDKGSLLSWLVDDRAALPPHQIWCLTHPIERATVRLHVCCCALPRVPRQWPLPLACQH